MVRLSFTSEISFQLVLHDGIFLAIYLTMLEKEIHYKLKETCYMLQSQAATCNGFQKSLQSLQKVELSSTTSVKRCNFLCNKCCNGIERQDAGRLQCVTCLLCNSSSNFFLFLLSFHKLELGSTLCNDYMDCLKIIEHCRSS